MPVIRFSDDELDAIMTACKPIPVERRPAFMNEVAKALVESGEPVGPGSLHRAIAVTQRRFTEVAVGRMPYGPTKYG
jgi:hypothetical protein